MKGLFSSIRRLPSRLQWRLTAVTLLLLVVGISSVGVAQYLALRGYLLQQLADTVRIQVKPIIGEVQQLRQPPSFGNSQGAIYSIDGRALVAPPTKQTASQSVWIEPPPQQVQALVSSFPGGGSKQPASSDTLPYRLLPGPTGEVMLNAFPLSSAELLLVETPLRDADAILHADLAIFAVAASIVLFLTMLAGVWLTSRALRGLHQMTVAASEISDGAYERRTGIHGDDEVGNLAAAFDRMVDRLQERIIKERESEARMRRFLADASHELRTPVAGMLGHLEVQRRGAFENPRDREASFSAMHSAATRMATLVDDLLVMTRLDNTDSKPVPANVDVATLLTEASKAAELRTVDRPVEVEPSVEQLIVVGNPDALERIIVNLLDNAAKYSPKGSRVRLTSRSGVDGQAEILVTDEGPGIPLSEQERIFERFYRVDESRSNSSFSGNGLGLAISRELARRHGGDVIVRSEVGKGSTFILSLPLSGQTLGGV